MRGEREEGRAGRVEEESTGERAEGGRSVAAGTRGLAAGGRGAEKERRERMEGRGGRVAEGR